MSNGNDPPARRSACPGSTERRAAIGYFCVAVTQNFARRRQQSLEVLARVLAALIRVVEQGIRLAAGPDRHDERVVDEPCGHLGLHRPADDAPREEVNDRCHVEPALGRPYVGEVSDPPLVRALCVELTIKPVGSDCRTLALIFGQGALAWPCPGKACAGSAPNSRTHLRSTFSAHRGPGTPVPR